MIESTLKQRLIDYRKKVIERRDRIESTNLSEYDIFHEKQYLNTLINDLENIINGN